MKNQNNLEMKNKTNQLNKKSKTMNNQNNLEMTENSKNNINKLPFDVMNNIKLTHNQIGYHNNLMS